MKKFLVPSVVAVVLASFAGCDQKSASTPPPAPDKAEIERQVQQRLAEEHQAEAAQKLTEKEQALTQREQDLAAREQTQQQAQTQPAQPLPAYAGVDTTDTQVGNPPVDQQTAETQEPGDYQVFYNDLDPDGDWIQTDTYGYVWHPYADSNGQGWRPYSNGHWVYTESGWTWVSNERFGWATYHYGRWAQIPRVGWIWVPGKQWAPAWVSWRNGNDYVGWAPLPPEARMGRNHPGFGKNVDAEFRIGAGNYSFVQVGQFRSPSMRDVVVDRSRNAEIINQTTNITNITNTNKIVINNGNNRQAVVNQGPQADFIAERTKMPVKKLMLAGGRTPDSASVVNGDKLEIASPTLDATAGSMPAKPKKVKERLTGVRAAETEGVAGQTATPAQMPGKAQGRPGEPKVTGAQGAPGAISMTSGTNAVTPVRPGGGKFPGGAGKPTATPPVAAAPATPTPAAATPAASTQTTMGTATPGGGKGQGPGRPGGPRIPGGPDKTLATPVPQATLPPATPRSAAVVAPTATPAQAAMTPDPAIEAARQAELEKARQEAAQKTAEAQAAKQQQLLEQKQQAEQARKAAAEAQANAAREAAQQKAEQLRQQMQEQQKAQQAQIEAAREAAQKNLQLQQMQQQREKAQPPAAPVVHEAPARAPASSEPAATAAPGSSPTAPK